MKHLLLLIISISLFNLTLYAQNKISEDSITILTLVDSTQMIGYVLIENDTLLVFVVYHVGNKMFNKSKIASRENKLKSDVDLSIPNSNPKTKKESALFPTIAAVVDPLGYASSVGSAESLPMSNKVSSRQILKKAHRIWITPVAGDITLYPKRSFLYRTTDSSVLIVNVKDTSGKVIQVPAGKIKKIKTRKYTSGAEEAYGLSSWLAACMNSGAAAGAVVFIVTAPIVIILSVAQSLKKNYPIEGNLEYYQKIKPSLTKRALIK